MPIALYTDQDFGLGLSAEFGWSLARCGRLLLNTAFASLRCEQGMVLNVDAHVEVGHSQARLFTVDMPVGRPTIL